MTSTIMPHIDIEHNDSVFSYDSTEPLTLQFVLETNNPISDTSMYEGR